MGKTDDLRALEKNCQLNSSTMLAQKRKKQKIIFVKPLLALNLINLTI